MKFYSALALAMSMAVSVTATKKNKKSRNLDAIRPGSSIKAESKMGSELLSKARRLDNANLDYTFIGGYSLKFQGCHHINQWNEYADDEEDVRIMTKRLIRFRLCPTDMCQDSKTAGCSSHYGDYVVDLNTFVLAYLEADAYEKEALCEAYQQTCENNCGGNDDDCMANCYGDNEATYCIQRDYDDDAYVEPLDPYDYAACAQYQFEARDDDDDAVEAYYVGPYCADQGGEINMGLFTDDTCTTFSNGGKNLFYTLGGYELPYSSDNLVRESCLTCMQNDGDDDAVEWNDRMDEAYVKEFCSNIYLDSGKCETKMSTDYPNEAACSYIEGIKIIRDDGVIRTTSVKKSRAAAVSIGLFTTVAVLLGAYVYYLRTKLSRAKISLSSQG